MKKGKLVARILLSVLAVILVLLLTAFLYVKFKLLPQIREFINDPAFVALMEELEQEDLDAIMGTVDEAIDGSESASEVVQPTEEDNPEATQPAQTVTPTKKPASQSNKLTSERIEELSKELPANDVAAAVALASKADPGYILGLLKGGLTIEEKRELKAYLNARFTKAEIRQGIALYNKYSYLLK